MEINGNMLNLEEEIKNIINNDSWAKEEIEHKWILRHSLSTPEHYENMDFESCGLKHDPTDFVWRIYGAALREFGVVKFVQDFTTGTLYLESTRNTVKLLISQYGLRNVTNEFAKQISEIYGKETIRRYIEFHRI